jgi:hypothetical protein
MNRTMRRGKEGATGGTIHITVTLLLHEQKYRTCTGNLSQPHNIRQMGTPVSALALRQPTGEVRVPRSGGLYEVSWGFAHAARGWTSLSSAAWGGHAAVVALLVDTDGVVVDLKDNKERTPLFLAEENHSCSATSAQQACRPRFQRSS